MVNIHKILAMVGDATDDMSLYAIESLVESRAFERARDYTHADASVEAKRALNDTAGVAGNVGSVPVWAAFDAIADGWRRC